MSEIIYEQRDRIAYVTLNRPQALNAITVKMWQDFTKLMASISGDPQVLVAILTGAGNRSFCVGQDIKEMVQSEDEKLELMPNMGGNPMATSHCTSRYRLGASYVGACYYCPGGIPFWVRQ